MHEKIAIRVRHLGKRYRLGGPQERYLTFRDAIVNSLKAPLKGFHSEVPDEMFWALKDVSFDVEQGDVVGIIGRNGAGKSTLLKILSRITTPTEGTAELYGRVGSLLEVGTGFHPEMTGRENIFLNGSILGMRKTEIEEKFDEIVKFSEIEAFLDTPVKRYSSGMYVRLAFAVAAHLEPEILIIDEVLAVGDAQFQKKCLGKMGEVAKEGRTVLFVSHNMNAIEQLCTSCILLEKGRIWSSGPDVHRIIKGYIFGEQEGVRSTWQNTSNEFDNPWFKPTIMYLSDEKNNRINTPIRNNDNIWFNIEGKVGRIASELTIGYAIFTEEGQLLYWSYQTDDPANPPVKAGYNRLKSRIPNRLFNEGIYRIEFIGGLHNIKWLYEPSVSAPSIYLQIQGGLSESQYWLGKRPGLLAPVLKWEISGK